MSTHSKHFHVLPHHSNPNSGKGPLVQVQARIQAVLPDDNDPEGGTHQHLQIKVERTLKLEGSNLSDINGQILFVAIRFGDELGLPDRIPELRQGEPIEAQGEYIEADRAKPGPDNHDPVLPVLHFTHAPVGFIIYHGVTYGEHAGQLAGHGHHH
jgi:hypothetical protein